MNLPQIDKRPILRRTDTPFKMDHRSPHSPDASSFLNVANMHLSPREKASEETKGKSDIKSANYLFYEPPFDDHVTAGIDMSQYAFRTTLERIPETDGERLLSGHGKRNSNSGDEKKQTSHTTQQKSEGHKVLAKVNQPITGDKKQMVCVRNLDLFAQQRQHFARNGHLTRVAFSYKMIQGDPRSLIEQTNQETVDSPTKAPQLRPNAKDVVFPQIVLYQWEVHEQQKFIKAHRQRKPRKKLHRIPTGNTLQEHQQADSDNDKEKDDIGIRPDGSVFKFPRAPPTTPKCDSSKEMQLLKSGSRMGLEN